MIFFFDSYNQTIYGVQEISRTQRELIQAVFAAPDNILVHTHSYIKSRTLDEIKEKKKYHIKVKLQKE